MTQRAVDLLRRTRLFGGLGEETLEKVARSARLRSYRRGQLLFHAGDPGDSLFVLVEGSVKVTVPSEDRDDLVLVTLEPPETLGEVSLLDGGSRSASVEALRPTQVLAVTRDDFLAIVASDRPAIDSLLAHLTATVRRLIEHSSDLVFLDLHERVARALVRMADAHGRLEGRRVTLDLPLTQGDLAAMVGGSRPAVNQVLRVLEERGHIKLQGRALVIDDLPRLRAAAGA